MKRRSTALTAVLSLFLVLDAEAQTVHHVDPLGDDTAVGTVMAPLRTIGEAFLRSAAGDTVSLADGVHLGVGNRGLVMPTHPVVVRSASGVRESCIIDCEASDRAFTVDALQDTTTVIEGVTIRNGLAVEGGAIYVGEQSELLIRNCFFVGNRAVDGGALYCRANATGSGGPYASLGCGPVVRACRFEANEATNTSWGYGAGGGGAVCGWFGSSPWIADCEFVANVSGACGGAVSLYFESGGFIQRSTFTSNRAGYAGGALDVSTEQWTYVVDCRFEANDAPRGGAVSDLIGESKKSADKAAGEAKTFDRCEFVSNTAENGGAAYFWFRSNARFNDCGFIDNEASTAGGAIMHEQNNELVFTRCLFAGNSSPNGGAFRQVDTDPSEYGLVFHTTLASCTLVNNTSPVGSAISYEHIQTFERDWMGFDISNTILSHNLGGSTIELTNVAPPLFSCSDLFANEGGDWTGVIAPQVDLRGNFSADPCYCDAGAGDYHLSGDSWCLPGNHPWGCEGLVGAFGEGCEDNGCNGPVATLISGFQAEAFAGRVALDWRVDRGLAATEFRLEAVAGAERWPVALKTSGQGRFTAVDDAPQLLQADAATYTLYAREASGDWREIWAERVDLPAAVRPTRLTGVHPNPFNPMTTVSFDLDKTSQVSLDIYDLSGRRIRTLIANGTMARGPHEIMWNGCDDAGRSMAAGMYFVRLAAGTTRDVRRMMLIK